MAHDSFKVDENPVVAIGHREASIHGAWLRQIKRALGDLGIVEAEEQGGLVAEVVFDCVHALSSLTRRYILNDAGSPIYFRQKGTLMAHIALFTLATMTSLLAQSSSSYGVTHTIQWAGKGIGITSCPIRRIIVCLSPGRIA